MDVPAAPSATVYNPNPPVPEISDTASWVTAWFTIHALSVPSRRYSYYLWIIVGSVFSVVVCLHLLQASTGLVGAYWAKWALRRRTLRKKHARMVAWRTGRSPQPYTLPPNGQILSLVALFITTLGLAFIGPDYIFPNASVAQFWNRDTKYASYIAQYTIDKAWWTSGGRTGTIAFALFPLCILFGIKQWPFAIFANPYTVQFHFDKLVWLHRWTGRFIWFITLLHVLFYSAQLFVDRREGTGVIAYHYAFYHLQLIYGWTAFGLLSGIILFSLPPIRTKYYEWFYAGHIFLIPTTLIFSALHHPPIQWWCWAALALWGGERIHRAIRWMRINSFGRSTPALPPKPRQPHANREEWEMDQMHDREASMGSKHQHRRSLSEATLYKALTPFARTTYAPPPGFAHAQVLSGRTIRLTFTAPGYFAWAPGQHFLINIPHISKLTSHPFTCASVCDMKSPGDTGRVNIFLIRAKGGFTKDLWNTVTSLTTQFKTTAPGEKLPKGAELPKHGVLLRMFVDGPFGSSSRARWGDYSTVLIIAGGSGVSFGLAVLEYICLCIAGRDSEQLGGRSSGWGRRSFKTTRVRFVWLVREFAHIQWCATTLRRCLALVPAPALRVDIFVTNFKTMEHERANPKPPVLRSPPAGPTAYAPVAMEDTDQLLPPAPGFVRQHSGSLSSLASANSSVESFVDMNPITETFGDPIGEEEPQSVDLGIRDNYTLDLTNFEGDDDDALPGEDALSHRVRKQGKMLRAKTRKAQKAATEAMERAGTSPSARQNHRRTESEQSTDSTMSAGRPLSGHFEVDLTHHDPDTGSLSPPGRRPSSPRSSSPRATNPRRVSALAGEPIRPASALGKDWDEMSVKSLIMNDGMDGLRLEVEDDEMADVNVVAECARPGKPKIERILADEVEHSDGATIVGCCGPSSLNAIIRKAIALQIDTTRIRQGDMRGYISLLSEEFAY